MDAAPKGPPHRLLDEQSDVDSPLGLTEREKVAPREPRVEKQLDKRTLDYVLRTGLAGGIAGCAAKTVVGPLDRVKILFQASNPQFAKYTGSWFGVFTALRDINKTGGVRGLFRGHSATLLRVFPYAGIKFLAYEQIRARVITSTASETPGRRFIAGSLAGITSVFFTYPLEVIRVRLAFETKKDSSSSLSRICRQIYGERSGNMAALVAGPQESVVIKQNLVTGLANFYRGFYPTLLGMLPYAGMSFLTHDTVGDWLRHPSVAKYTVIRSTAQQQMQPGGSNQPRRSQLTAPAELTSGAIAGLVSQTASYPLEVIRRRMQVSGAVGDGHRMGIMETARKIFAERGLRGFFVGLSIGYLKIVPMVSTSFFVYERGKWWLGIES